MTLVELADLVSGLTGYDRKETRVICEFLVEVLLVHLNGGQEVRIRGLGVFEWVPRRAGKRMNVNTGEVEEVPARMQLRFRPSRKIRKEIAMEKYGVEMDDSKTKEASKKKPGTCPLCGAKLDDGGACPAHGTEPFEKREEK